jgi:hypothetical protein
MRLVHFVLMFAIDLCTKRPHIGLDNSTTC